MLKKLNCFKVGNIKAYTVENSEFINNYFVNSETQTKEIIIEGQVNQLLKEYINTEAAMEEATQKFSEVFDLIKKVYDFDNIDKNNYKSYQNTIDIVFEDYNLPNQYYMPMKVFFDIYENTDENSEIKNIVRQLEESRYTRSAENIRLQVRLIDLLAKDNPYVKDHNEQSDEGIAEYNAIYNDNEVDDISTYTYAKVAAINMAIRYALNPNTSYNYYEGRDCTNFVSQVASGGGKDPIKKGDVENGWWFNFANKTESISWIRADRFVKFWGTQLETISFRDFSASVRDGDYISIDFGDDGKWDHCGFVVAWNDDEGTYTYKFPNSSSTLTLKYHNFKIAQHTTNRLDWVNSDDISWEAAGPEAGSRGKYALIRRSNFVEAKP